MTSYFEEFYATHLPDSMSGIKELPGGFLWVVSVDVSLGIKELLPKLYPILTRKFGFYALFEAAKEYGGFFKFLAGPYFL
jgi:hypothetical protein